MLSNKHIYNNFILSLNLEYDNTSLTLDKDSIIINNFDCPIKRKVNLADINFNHDLLSCVNFVKKSITDEMKKKITTDISKFLNEMGKISDKNEKRKLSLELMNYLIHNKIFLEEHEKFKITVSKKFKELYKDYVTDEERNKLLEYYLILFHFNKIEKLVSKKEKIDSYPLDSDTCKNNYISDEIDFILDN